MINSLQRKKALVMAAKAAMMATKIAMRTSGMDTSFLDVAFEMGMEVFLEAMMEEVM